MPAALDSNPSQKGGLYSIGTDEGGPGFGVAGKRQYGVCEVTYGRTAMGEPTGEPTVTWIGRRAGKRGSDQPRIRDVIRHQFPAARSFAGFEG